MLNGRVILIRKQKFSGTLYPSTYEETISFLREKSKNEITYDMDKIIAIIAPNESYKVAGSFYVESYSAVKNYKPDLILILSSVHNIAFNSIALPDYDSFEYFDKQFKVDKEAMEIIRSVNEKDIIYDKNFHETEFSIETQLPMIDYTFGSEVMIAPVIMGEQNTKFTTILANAIGELRVKLKKRILIVIPTILSSGLNYQQSLIKDGKFIEFFNSTEPDLLSEQLAMRVVSADSGGPIVALLRYFKAEKIDIKTLVLKNGNSGDIIDEKNIVTGYLSAVIRTCESTNN